MSAPFEDLFTLDRLVHEPARLAILTALAACRRADYLFLESITGIPQGNLSGHLAKLEQAGLVTIEKTFRGKTPRTKLQLTAKGRTSIEQHWYRLEALHKAAEDWGLKFRRRVTAE